MTNQEYAWEIVEQKTSYDCPGFRIISQTVRLPDGTVTDFDYLSEPPAVIILPLTENDNVVTINEWREPVRRINHGIPVGTVEENEDLTMAAHRELTEETGYEAATVTHLGTFEPTNGVTDSVHHYYVATGCQPSGTQDLDLDEQIEVELIDYPTFEQAALAGELRDGRAVMAVHRYRDQERNS